MSNSVSIIMQNIYEIKIQGQMDTSWLDGFGEVNVHTQLCDDEQQITVLSNLITDQAGLVGLIRRLHGIGIILISTQLLEPASPNKEKEQDADERRKATKNVDHPCGTGYD